MPEKLDFFLTKNTQNTDLCAIVLKSQQHILLAQCTFTYNLLLRVILLLLLISLSVNLKCYKIISKHQTALHYVKQDIWKIQRLKRQCND